ncbi:hypothetical protein ASPWEDRAFT_167679 [Aspergillus wentii DTO 134E9]|uniref:F-box domain-containing protein n=1 Tax=Aspergillus wentii DTO 134E9 TaxID=1073089 RepID=A0A1L9S3D1_ASPWE|nr:uncharacterized protein ASPWEDRAFT_167679 [Aspergillus wentii DTO 134E9]KAI9930013.1 hypothetical protein MW887_011823 [Aspergillus wentii]OJJ41672.1 hypothetical protein ASPWEDRAFT_167679 [Aspergillus wentii DTO 134E9]
MDLQTFPQFANLPPELVLNMSDFLDIATLAHLSQSSKQVHTLLHTTLQQAAREVALPSEEEYQSRIYTDISGLFQVSEANGTLDRPRERLAQVVVMGQYEAVKFLLDAGVDPNAHTIFGFRMLCLAVGDEAPENGFPIVDLLLEYGADPSLPNVQNSEWTPLGAAAYMGYDFLVQKLLRAGADVNAPGVIHTIVKFCRMETIQMAVSLGADLRQPLPATGETVLRWAMDSDYPEILPLMLKELPDLISTQNVLGQSLLWPALNLEDMDIITMLVDAGIDLNIQDDEGDTALHYAISLYLPQPALLFIERGINVGVRAHRGLTELHHAANTGLIEVVSPLLARGNVDINAQTNWLETPLHLAVEKGYSHIVRKLIACGADLSITDTDQRTPMDLAVFLGRRELWLLLYYHMPS